MKKPESIEGTPKRRTLFMKYNSGRIDSLIANLQERKIELFKLIPFFLHINKPALPGYVDNPLALYGIYGLPDTGFWDFSLQFLKLDEAHMMPWLSRKNHIIGLYLMGSSGTVAQGFASDFDYWLIIDQKTCSKRQLALLNEKIEGIKKWSYEQFRHEVEFFVMDISDLRKNHFSAITDESSGTAQKTILKEEFYRTFIYIAGKLPYWAVFLPGLSDKEYGKCVHALEYESRDQDLENEYIDLGNIEKIDKDECLGAILWQIFKARKDPVKALIKSLLIVYYHFQEKNDPLPCDMLKDRIFGDDSGKIADPYVIIFLVVLKRASGIGNRNILKFLEESIFLRLSGYPSMRNKKDSIVKKIINGYVIFWGWTLEKKDRFSLYSSWPEDEKIEYEHKLVENIGFLYELVLKSSDESKPDFQMKKTDQEILLSKLSIHFQKKKGKIFPCSAYLKVNSEKNNLIIQYEPTLKTWSVYNTPSRYRLKKEWVAYQSSGLLDVIAWMVYNKLFQGDFKRIFFEGIPVTVKEKTLKDLFSYIFDNSYSCLKPGSIGEKPKWNLLLAFVMPDFSGTNQNAVQMGFISCNTWGEFYYKEQLFDPGDNNSVKSFKMADVIYYNFMKDREDIPHMLYDFCTNDGDALLERTRTFLNVHKEKGASENTQKEIPVSGSDNRDINKIILDTL